MRHNAAAQYQPEYQYSMHSTEHSTTRTGNAGLREKVAARSRQIAAALLCLFVAAAFLIPASALAHDPEKTVRVGWYESSFNQTDEFGRRSGYAYEYQRKIAAYTGWHYEYVEGSWPELLQMLIDGEIDLMSDVSYTEERAAYMLFPDLPMGAEEYFLFKAPDNREISSSDPAKPLRRFAGRSSEAGLSGVRT